MYCPKEFVEDRVSVLHGLIQNHALGAWTCWADSQLVVNHIPFILDASQGEYGTLSGHVARANPIWKLITDQSPSVVVFQGADAYITPNWYPSKQEHGKVVPTWNYAVVHAHGQPNVIDDADWLLAHVASLSDQHEAGNDTPWKVSDAPEGYTKSLSRGIVGIEIPIRRLEGRWKVSQNKNDADKAGVIKGLKASTKQNERLMQDWVSDHA